ncbi:MAG: aminoacyl-tRNA hydrolase [Candidatus Pacebacteria bacterium]|nr:aminoacyl-tRNA hydrolase [Candidatus Paceibacterota bacterium]
MYIIVGLGNPGKEYAHSRHNTGHIIVEEVRILWKFPEWKEDKKLKALVSKGKRGGKSVTLVFPETFMNKSGVSLKHLVTSVKKAEKLGVVHDDLDLPLGTLKLSFNRGSAGHRGVESIMRAVKTKGFLRFRVGVSEKTSKGIPKKPRGEKAVNSFILNNFKPKEEGELKKVAHRVNIALDAWLTEGRGKATEVAHRK